MWFKNLKLYRLAPGATLTAATLEEALKSHTFTSGGSQDRQACGWIRPREDSGLVYARDGQLLLRLRMEKKLLPASVVSEASRARATQIEEQQGYKPGRKQMREIREQITMELLPRAFAVVHDTLVWIDTCARWVAIDTSATVRSDEVIGMLAKALDPFPIIPLHVETSPAAAMTSWLADDEAPAGFSIDQDSELQSTGESRATVRYVRQSVEASEVARHVRSGKQVTRLALTYADRVSFVLTDDLDLKRVTALDVLKEHDERAAQNEDEQFDSDFAFMTGELSHLLGDLIAALGGEHAPGRG